MAGPTINPSKQSKHELQRNSVSFAGAVALSGAFMGPAVSIFYDVGLAAGVAGRAFPLSFLLSLIAVLFVASSVIAFSRKVQSAGFAFTYARAGLGAKAGFMSGWIALLAYAMAAPLNFTGFAIILSEFLQRQFAFHVSWIWFFVAASVAASALSCSGINHSTRATLIFLGLEISVLAALFGSVIFGGAHNSVQPFLYRNMPHGLSSLGAGMVFGILSFTGFEAAANLGGNPQRLAHDSACDRLFRRTDRSFLCGGRLCSRYRFSPGRKGSRREQRSFRPDLPPLLGFAVGVGDRSDCAEQRVRQRDCGTDFNGAEPVLSGPRGCTSRVFRANQPHRDTASCDRNGIDPVPGDWTRHGIVAGRLGLVQVAGDHHVRWFDPGLYDGFHVCAVLFPAFASWRVFAGEAPGCARCLRAAAVASVVGNDLAGVGIPVRPRTLYRGGMDCDWRGLPDTPFPQVSFPS